MAASNDATLYWGIGAMADLPRVLDISVSLGTEAPPYPGDVPFERTVQSTLEEGAPYDLSSVTLSAHAGTHLDAPAHVAAGGRRLDDYAAGEFVLPARVVAVDGAAVTPEDVAAAGLRPGEALLFQTRNSRSGMCRTPRFSPDYVYVSAEAAALCVARGAALVGIDYLSVDAADDERLLAHHALLDAGTLVLEGLDLSRAVPGRYLLVCLPLKIPRGEASPVRAVLLSGVSFERDT